jgi:hypothetical protein
MHVHLMINGHADCDHLDKTDPAQFESEIMPAPPRPAEALTPDLL